MKANVGNGKVWNEGVLNRIIRNPLNRGVRRNGGNLEAEELVPFAVWQQAIAVLESRRTGGARGKKHATSLLIPYCSVCWGTLRDGCANGQSKMYQHVYRDLGPMFRCTGSGPLRRSCGAHMVPSDIARSDGY